MTEKVEGVAKEVRQWLNGKGADVYLNQDKTTYYYEGKVDIPLGKAIEMEVTDGEGENSKKKQILSCRQPQMNPAQPPKMPLPPGMPPPAKKMIQLPYDDFTAMMSKRLAISEVRIRSLEAAVKIYAAMPRMDKDPKYAADVVVTIAKVLAGHLA